MKKFKNKHKLFMLSVALLILFILSIAGIGQTSERPSLIFTKIFDPVTKSEDCKDAFSATILVFDKNTWRIVNLPENFGNSSWQFAGRAKTGKDVWAIADYAVEGRGWELETAYSADDGRTWKHISSLRKISFDAEFYSFTMTRSEGQLTIKGSDNNDREGYFTYTTTNKGLTWSKTPAYSKKTPPDGENSIEKLPLAEEDIGKPCSS